MLSSQADACLFIPNLRDAALSFRAKPDECQPTRGIARSLPGAGGLTVPVWLVSDKRGTEQHNKAWLSLCVSIAPLRITGARVSGLCSWQGSVIKTFAITRGTDSLAWVSLSWHASKGKEIKTQTGVWQRGGSAGGPLGVWGDPMDCKVQCPCLYTCSAGQQHVSSFCTA